MKIMDEAKRNELTQMRQRQILEAAVEVFSKKGFAQTQVDEITNLAGLGKGTVYRYFKDKEDIFLSAVDRGLKDLTAAVLDAMAKERKLIEKIKKAIEAYLEFFEKHPWLNKIFAQGQNEFQRRLRKRYLQSYFEHINEIGKVFKEAQDLGLIKRDLEPRLSVAILTDMLNSFVYIWQITEKRFSLRESFSFITDIYFTGVLEQKDR